MAYFKRFDARRRAAIAARSMPITNQKDAEPSIETRVPARPLGYPEKTPPAVAHHRNSPGEAMASAISRTGELSQRAPATAAALSVNERPAMTMDGRTAMLISGSPQ